MRLGLVLAEIGRRENIAVTDAELGDAMRAEAMRYGAQAQEIFDLLRRNPDVQAQMRAPLYEEKVVDFIVGRAAVTERSVTKEELLREDDLPEGYGASEHGGRPSRSAVRRRRSHASSDGAAERGAPVGDAEAAPARP